MKTRTKKAHTPGGLWDSDAAGRLGSGAAALGGRLQSKAQEAIRLTSCLSLGFIEIVKGLGANNVLTESFVFGITF